MDPLILLVNIDEKYGLNFDCRNKTAMVYYKKEGHSFDIYFKTNTDCEEMKKTVEIALSKNYPFVNIQNSYRYPV